MVIGNKGEKIKTIGTEARIDMERLFQNKVHLELWVKVKSGWADDEQAPQPRVWRRLIADPGFRHPQSALSGDQPAGRVFTQDSGRWWLAVPAGHALPLKGLLQPFTLLTIAWRGRGSQEPHPGGVPGSLVCASAGIVSLRPLSQRAGLLPAGSAHPLPEVFDAYARAIMALADMRPQELPLRRFEFYCCRPWAYAVD